MIRRCANLSILILVFALFAGCSDDAGTARPSNNQNNELPDAGDPDVGDPDPEDMADGPTSCAVDSDCDSPEICVFNAASGDLICAAPEGSGEIGDACTTGEDCASGLCINSACAAPCTDGQDCPNGFDCETVSVDSEQGAVELDVCVPGDVPCRRDLDCPESEVCVVDSSGDSVSLTCGPGVGAGELGDTCSSDSECASNLCVDSACASPCERPNDCGDTSRFTCDSTEVSLGSGATESLNVCQPRLGDSCLADSECTLASERCIAARGTDTIDFGCGAPNAGGAELGESCSDDLDCAQNLCIDDTCRAPCSGTGDCTSAEGFACETTSVQLTGAAATASICVPPVDCTEDDGCRVSDGEVCFVRGDAPDLELVCRDPNVGGGDLGQICVNDRECANNFCVDTRFRRVCTTPCTSNDHCGVPGYECQVRDFDGQDVEVCVPSSPTACTSNDQCPTGTRCAIVENVASDALESVCIPAGADATGVACNADDDCASLVCLEGFCAAPCTDSTQCGQGQLCQSNEIQKAGLSQDFDVCETLGDEQCTDTQSCSDGVRVCSELRDVAGTTTPFCNFPNESASGQLGDACTTSSECREDLCLTVSDECSVVCDDDSDCGVGQGCTTYTVSTPVNFCTSTCSDDSDCDQGKICTINGDELTNDVDLVCEKPVGPEDLGSPCQDGSECITGLCLRTLQYQGTSCTTSPDSCPSGQECSCPLDDPNCSAADRECAIVERACTRVCDGAGDCATSAFASNELTDCSPNTTVQRPNSGTKDISTCARP